MQRIRDVHSGVSSGIQTARQIPTRTREKIGSAAVKTRDICYNCFAAAFSIAVLALISIVIYGAFYRGYIPSPLIQAPMTIDFKPCHSSPGKCSSLSAVYNLSEILMNDQPYVFAVRIDLPESPPNRNHGMFLSCLKVSAKDGSLLREQCKSSLLPHYSFIVRQLRNLIFSPGTVLGYINEKETIEVEFFKDFMDDDPYNPAKKVHFVIKSRFLEIYGAELRIRADFRGIRSFMYFYPITATIVGSFFYLSLFIFVLVISWLRYSHEEDDYERERDFQVAEDEIDVIKSQIHMEHSAIEELNDNDSNLDFKKKLS